MKNFEKGGSMRKSSQEAGQQNDRQEVARQFTAAMDSLNQTLSGFGAGGRDLESNPITDEEIREEIEQVQKYYPGTREDLLRHFNLQEIQGRVDLDSEDFSAMVDAAGKDLSGWGAGGRDIESNPITLEEIRQTAKIWCHKFKGSEHDLENLISQLTPSHLNPNFTNKK